MEKKLLMCLLLIYSSSACRSGLNLNDPELQESFARIRQGEFAIIQIDLADSEIESGFQFVYWRDEDFWNPAIKLDKKSQEIFVQIEPVWSQTNKDYAKSFPVGLTYEPLYSAFTGGFGRLRILQLRVNQATPNDWPILQAGKKYVFRIEKSEHKSQYVRASEIIPLTGYDFDIVFLTNGKKLKGKVLKQELGEYVIIKTNDSVEKISWDQIKELQVKK